MIRIGLLGAGRIGVLHTDNLLKYVPGVELVSIFEPFEVNAKKAAETFPGVPCVESAEAVFNSPDVDAVLVCSSTDTHSQYIEAAARAGKHIFCEKPIDFDEERILQALNAVEDAGVKLQIGFNRRFDRNFAGVRNAIQAGRIGSLRSIKITSRDPGPPPVSYIRVSGGLFNDMTIHDFDMARFIMGEEVVEVFAQGANLVSEEIQEAGDIDTAMISLRFESGALGVIDNSRHASFGYDQRVEVFGSDGCLFAENEDQDKVVCWSEQGQDKKPLPHFFLERYRQSYVNEVNDFIASIQNDTVPPVTGTDGLWACRIAKACYQSLKEKRPVRLEEL